MRPLTDQVVVITGASSGIGRETAQRLASRGASVVLAARNEVALRDLEASIEVSGGRAHAVVADVAEYEAVRELGDAAIARFGRIDTWINNAGVTVYAKLTDTSPDELERVIRVNLLGVIHGTKVAIERMRDQGEGSIINVSSVLGMTAVPLQSAYVASKHGVRGFTDAVRIELEAEGSGISLTTVYPASMNTPLFAHARSKLGVMPRPIAPVYDPQLVADVLAAAAERPRRDVIVGGAGRLFTIATQIAPDLVDRYLVAGHRGEREQRTDRPDDGRDNLESPLTEPGASRGDVVGLVRGWGVFTQLGDVHPVRGRVAPVVALAATGLSILVVRTLAGRIRGHAGA